MFVQTKVEILARLAGAASDEGTRYYLCGVHARRRVRTEGLILEATNGHILALEHDFAGSCSENNAHSLILCRHAIGDMAKAAKAFAKAHRVAFDDVRVRVEAHSFTLSAGDVTSTPYTLQNDAGLPAHAFIDGAYPECERVIPHPRASAVPSTGDAYNARLLFQLAKTSGGTVDKTSKPKTGEKPLAFVLYAGKELGSPALMRVSGAPNWLGVIMPMRVDGPSTIARPSWFYGETPMAAAAE